MLCFSIILFYTYFCTSRSHCSIVGQHRKLLHSWMLPYKDTRQKRALWATSVKSTLQSYVGYSWVKFYFKLNLNCRYYPWSWASVFDVSHTNFHNAYSADVLSNIYRVKSTRPYSIPAFLQYLVRFNTSAFILFSKAIFALSAYTYKLSCRGRFLEELKFLVGKRFVEQFCTLLIQSSQQHHSLSIEYVLAPKKRKYLLNSVLLLPIENITSFHHVI